MSPNEPLERIGPAIQRSAGHVTAPFNAILIVS
jgi:hypothetical protein